MATPRAGAAQPGDQPAESRGSVAHVVVPMNLRTSWIRFQGWSSDSRRLAYREGDWHTPNRIGAPLDIVRLGLHGGVEDRMHVASGIKAAMNQRGIIDRGGLPVEPVGPSDRLVQTQGGAIFAVVVRPAPAMIGVLRRAADGSYRLVHREPLPAALDDLRLDAHESPDRRWLALTIHVGHRAARRGTLWVVSTASNGGEVATAPPEGREIDGQREAEAAAKAGKSGGERRRAASAPPLDLVPRHRSRRRGRFAPDPDRLRGEAGLLRRPLERAIAAPDSRRPAPCDSPLGPR
ncbi:MAG: hypothetical protein RIT45_2967 [Pseudomonadota bacterium]|jgi:hypothetical protein